MSNAKITLIRYIQEKFFNDSTPQELTAETDLLISGLVDSHGVLRIATFIEKSFNIKIPPRDIVIEHFRSVEAMSTYLLSRTS